MSALMALVVLCFTGGAIGGPPPPTLMIARDPGGGGQVMMPLVSESVRVEIDEQHATTVVQRVYDNASPMRVEGQFTYRAGEGTNVSGFAYWNGQQKIVGEVLEAGAARRVYTSTVQRRRDPGLLEKTGEGSFSFKIFPIEPGEKKRVELTLDQWLVRRDRAIEYRFPMSHPGSEMEIVIRDDRKIGRVSSATHAIEATGLGTQRVSVRVRPRDARELALRYELLDTGFVLHAHAHRDAGHAGYAVLSFSAPPLASDPGQDVTIVLDASAQMAGEPLQEARIAASRILRRLGSADRFNLVILDGQIRTVFPSPQWATRDARDRAMAQLVDLRGGQPSDLSMALQQAFIAQDSTPRHKTILMLSNGQSGARRAIQIAARDPSPTRVFTVGFGGNVDRPALARLASMKRGSFTFFESADALEARIDRLTQRIAAPGLTNLALQASGGTIRAVYPQRLPDLYPGQELVVVARVEGDGPMRFALRADAVGQGPVKFTTALDVAKEPKRPWIGKLWARERVGDLLEETALFGGHDLLKNEVIELALAYNIVTPYTSFLAIPASEVLTPEAAQTLADARRMKAQLLEANPEAAALTDEPGIVGAQTNVAGAPAMEAPSFAIPAPAPAPDMPAEARIRGGGCAGCRVGDAEPSPRAAIFTAIAIAILALRRRSR